jgi:hypothetical protein
MRNIYKFFLISKFNSLEQDSNGCIDFLQFLRIIRQFQTCLNNSNNVKQNLNYFVSV